MLRVWQEGDGLVCEVRDGSDIVQPLIGREEPAIGQIGGHGIWLVNLVCDPVQVRSSAEGSAVRMQMSRAVQWKRSRARAAQRAREKHAFCELRATQSLQIAGWRSA